MLHVPTSFPGFSPTRPYGARETKGRGTSRRETWQRACLAFTFVDFSDCLSAIGRFHSRGWQLCKFIATKERVYIRKEFNSHRTGLRDQDGGRDATRKGSIGCSTRPTLNSIRQTDVDTLMIRTQSRVSVRVRVRVRVIYLNQTGIRQQILGGVGVRVMNSRSDASSSNPTHSVSNCFFP